MLRTAILALLLAAPLVVAAESSTRPETAPGDPLAIRVGELHAGDRLRYEWWSDAEGSHNERMRIVEVLGAGVARDRFGIERDVVSYRVERYSNERMETSDVCHFLVESDDVVRVDGASGAGVDGQDGADMSGPALLYGSEASVETAQVAAFPDSCALPGLLRTPLAGEELAEGTTLTTIAAFGREVAGLAASSEPLARADFHGRPALEAAFNVTGVPGAQRVLVFADGLPGAVADASRMTVASVERISVAEQGSADLTGFQPGRGARVRTERSGATLPEANPVATFATLGIAASDGALDLPFAFAEALDAAMRDPGSKLSAWRAAHPNAILASASYDRERRAELPADASLVRKDNAQRTDGGWIIVLADGVESHGVSVTRVTGARSPAGGELGAPASAVHVEDIEGTDGLVLAAAPTVVNDATVRALAAASGIEAWNVSYYEQVAYAGRDGAPRVNVEVSSVPRERGSGAPGVVHGFTAEIDASSGALRRILSATRTTEPSPLSLFFTTPLDLPGYEASASEPARPKADVARQEGLSTSSLSAPVVAAGAAGLAALALVVKLILLPLYTRLVRARLLDNPVRARLYEQVRRDPGAHLAALEEFAGIGKGATRHHLDRLVHHGYVVETREGGYLRYFVAGEVPPEAARREAALRAGSGRAVYELFAAEPGISLREAAARLGMSAPSVHRAKKRLEKAGLLPAARMAEVREA